MTMKNRITIVFIAHLAILFVVAGAHGETVIAQEDELLAKYEQSDREFTRLQVEDQVAYFHQRKIGEAIVEKDFIRYIFDVNTGELIEQTTQWRDGLPDLVVPAMSREEAEALVQGEIRFSRLYIISPQTNIFPLDPIPDNPCWVVSSEVDGRIVVTIIDAITGQKLGYGIPPPYQGFSLHGPDWGDCPQDCIWYDWAESARSWFETMGYSFTEMVGCPSDAKVQSHIQTDDTAVFYELAHGNQWGFHNDCPDLSIMASEVETWMVSYASMPFTFIGSCTGMFDTTDNTLSHEFRKGYRRDAVTVGYREMSLSACESDCWQYAVDWQNTLFYWLNEGYTVAYAFDKANLAYPPCGAPNDCMRIAGDTQMTLVPEVTRSFCGNVYDGQNGPLTLNARDYYNRCGIVIPSGQTLTIDPAVRIAFLNESKIIANGTFNGNGSTNQIRFYPEGDTTKGLLTSGQIRLQNGGQMKIYQ
jgi:hypothetical protein